MANKSDEKDLVNWKDCIIAFKKWEFWVKYGKEWRMNEELLKELDRLSEDLKTEMAEDKVVRTSET